MEARRRIREGTEDEERRKWIQPLALSYLKLTFDAGFHPVNYAESDSTGVQAPHELPEYIVNAHVPHCLLVEHKHQANCVALQLYKHSDHFSLHTYFLHAIVSVGNYSQLLTFRQAAQLFGGREVISW
jgi:hypothetical protein